eukprot:TRINITY_DN14794_c0_g1_i1.p1 TRINITY_DN14794_c0_g1~~TRINITY_DN14794_c0_g1_i1.p1  ORF type:complete len:358 (+),score=130.88 TRINITY_DN14794_c0_g1_i1:29-1075(+)
MGICASEEEKPPHRPTGPQGYTPPPPHGGARSAQFGCPWTKHGAIVGKGGSTIKQLQSRHNVNIVVGSKEQRSEHILIEGSNAGIEAARVELEGILQFDLAEGPLHIYELDVPKNRYGGIIGSGGSTLRSIEQASRAEVVVPHRGAPESEKITIYGSQAACDKAHAQVNDVLGQVVSCRKRFGEKVSVQDIPRADLSKAVSRSLFFPDHDEEGGESTFQVFLRYLNAPKHTLDIAIFTMTNDAIANSVMDAHRRGVTVRVICDNDQAASLGADIHKLRQAGIPVRTDRKSEHMHHKFCILDGRVLMNGSFNWTMQAQTGNDENVMILSERKFITDFQKYYNKMWSELA